MSAMGIRLMGDMEERVREVLAKDKVVIGGLGGDGLS